MVEPSSYSLAPSRITPAWVDRDWSALHAPVGPEGFVVDGARIRELFVAHRVYPALPSASVDPDAIALWRAWSARSNRPMDLCDLPWLPVGLVGPLMILGHLDVGIRPPPLPFGTFQPVCLRREDYLKLQGQVAGYIETQVLGATASAADFVGGVGRFPTSLVFPTERGNALRFLREYFLHRPEHVAALDAALADSGSEDALPANYRDAVTFVVGEHAVAQPAAFRLIDGAQRRLSEPMRRRISIVAEFGQQIWCAAPTLPQPEAEDRLYAELGAGWEIHWLIRASSENVERPRPVTTSSSTAPFKIVLSAASYGQAGKADVVEAEERLIALAEIEWDRFDPRHRDSAEPESLWKWAVYRALMDGATDLHLEPGPHVTRVRQRIDGLLEEILEVPSSVGEAMVYSLMTQVGLGGDKYRPVDGSFQVEILGKVAVRNQSVRVRANAYPVRGVTQKLALRFLPRQGAVPSLGTLLPPRIARFLSRAISRPEGLVLVCGPTGSGKTTTIFSALSELNRSDVNVTTLENPVEILLEGTNQAEINPRRDVTWSALNRAFLRQDPDVGLIGEIRDEDTARTILRAALTGHLVFGSLHTKSCATSVIRMTDLGAEPNMLAESLVLIACQRLVRRVCPKCRAERPPNDEERILLEKHRVPRPAQLFQPGPHSTQCEHCRGRGYRGRAAAVEVLPNVPAIRSLIEHHAPSQAYGDWMKARGLPTVFENALELACAGITSLEEALTLQDAWEGNEWQNLY